MTKIDNSASRSELNQDVAAINQIRIIPQLLDVICRSTNMGFAAIARVTEKKWVTCTSKDDIEFGLKPGDELKIENTMCQQVRNSHEPIFIDHTEKDEIYCDHPIPKMYGISSYVSYPIFRKNGDFFGTLCAIDNKPASVKRPEITGMFKLFADLISFHLQTIEDVSSLNTKLEQEKNNAESREQFIAVLGHDLRNPVATTKMSAEIVQKYSQDKLAHKHAKVIKSTAQRMEGLINNLLDFARGRFGVGIKLELKENNKVLKKALLEVIREMKIISPEVEFIVNFDITSPVNCDAQRLAQLLSNLLTNAITHGALGRPVKVEAKTNNEYFLLSVINSGEKISEEALSHLFQPFYRNKVNSKKQGLGLGLFISAEIARAHGGIMNVESTEDNTTFTLTIPLKG